MKQETYNNIGKFIHIFNEIELFLNLIITHNIQPKDVEFFLDYILNTSVISFGAKIKILINLNIFDTNQIKMIRNYSNNRNVFAHSNREPHFVESIEENLPNVIQIKCNDVIFKTNSEGKITKMNYNKFITEHVLLQNKIIDFISEYIITNKINTHYYHIQNLKNKKQ